MRSSDKPVLLMSNDLSSNKNNTLTSFSGCIPPGFLNENKSWRVAVHSCGLDLMLKQPISSKYEYQPSLIQINFDDINKALEESGSFYMGKLDLGIFENSFKFFADRERYYTQKSLVEDLQHQAAIYEEHHGKSDGIPFKYEQQSGTISFGQFESDGEDSDVRISRHSTKDEKRMLRNYVFINARFSEALNLQPKYSVQNFSTTEIDGELYYYFFNSEHWKSDDFYNLPEMATCARGGVCFSAEKDFPLKEPEIIQIVSPDIEHNINNGIFCRSLRQFTIKRSEIKKGINKEFNNHQFSDVLNNSITKFSVKFVDEKLDELHLTRGLPSWIKLVFSTEMKNERDVRISSEPTELHPGNHMSNFSLELKQRFDFSVTDDPKVALTSLSFKNQWKIMPGLKLNITICHNCGTKPLVINDTTDIIEKYNFKTFYCPRGNENIRSCEDIIKWCKDLLNDEFSIEMKKQNNGSWSMNFPDKKYLIILGRDLAQCIGLSQLHNRNGELFTDLKKNNGGERDVSTEEQISSDVQSAIARYIMNMYGTQPDELQFESTGDIAIFSDSQLSLDIILQPREIQLYPNELYIFLNIVEPWPVIGQYRELLKIVHLKHDEHEERITIDYREPEYYALSEHHPKLLNFRIATVDGILIEPFNVDDKMYMTLKFSYNSYY